MIVAGKLIWLSTLFTPLEKAFSKGVHKKKKTKKYCCYFILKPGGIKKNCCLGMDYLAGL